MYKKKTYHNINRIKRKEEKIHSQVGAKEPVRNKNENNQRTNELFVWGMEECDALQTTNKSSHTILGQLCLFNCWLPVRVMTDDRAWRQLQRLRRTLIITTMNRIVINERVRTTLLHYRCLSSICDLIWCCHRRVIILCSDWVFTEHYFQITLICRELFCALHWLEN